MIYINFQPQVFLKLQVTWIIFLLSFWAKHYGFHLEIFLLLKNSQFSIIFFPFTNWIYWITTIHVPNPKSKRTCVLALIGLHLMVAFTPVDSSRVELNASPTQKIDITLSSYLMTANFSTIPEFCGIAPLVKFSLDKV